MTTYHTLTNAKGSWRVSLHAPDNRPHGPSNGAEAICMIDDATTVVIRQASGGLNTPGGPPVDGESGENTMIREVLEQACCEVLSWQLMAFARSECVNGPETGAITVRDMYLARVELLPWVQPETRAIERILVLLDQLVETMSADWVGLDAFSQELVALATEALPDL